MPCKSYQPEDYILWKARFFPEVKSVFPLTHLSRVYPVFIDAKVPTSKNRCFLFNPGHTLPTPPLGLQPKYSFCSLASDVDTCFRDKTAFTGLLNLPRGVVVQSMNCLLVRLVYKNLLIHDWATTVQRDFLSGSVRVSEDVMSK